MALLNPLSATSYKPPAIESLSSSSWNESWTHEPTAAQAWLEVQVGEERGLRAVIPGNAAVSSVMRERVSWAECEPFMNMQLESREHSHMEGRRREEQVLTWWQACGGCGGGSTAWRPKRKTEPLSHRAHTPLMNKYKHGFRTRVLKVKKVSPRLSF